MLIMLKFLTSIISFGRRGKDFYDDSRIQEGVKSIIFSTRFTANNDNIRVKVGVYLGNLHAHIACSDLTFSAY